MMDYHRQSRVDIRIARIFNTYGPRMSVEDGRVVSNFIVQALQGKPITVYGDGSQTRSFCYVSDLVAGLLALMETPDIFHPVNLGNPTEISVIELAEKVRDMVGTGSEIVFKGLPVDDPTRRKPDVRLAAEQLGWEPQVSLSEGLEQTIAYFDECLS
jgi:UDP-glucuronate decarboxylase